LDVSSKVIVVAFAIAEGVFATGARCEEALDEADES
jgi:hypothetical protein